jgi:hypothetical protein
MHSLKKSVKPEIVNRYDLWVLRHKIGGVSKAKGSFGQKEFYFSNMGETALDWLEEDMVKSYFSFTSYTDIVQIFQSMFSTDMIANKWPLENRIMPRIACGRVHTPFL